MSPQWKLSAIQWFKGLIIAVVPTLINTLIPMLSNESSIDLGVIVRTSLIGALTYIGLSLSADSKGVPFGNADKK